MLTRVQIRAMCDVGVSIRAYHMNNSSIHILMYFNLMYFDALRCIIFLYHAILSLYAFLSHLC